MQHFIVAAAIAVTCALPARGYAAPSSCVGDCDGSRDVTVDELVTMVVIALGGAAITTCNSGDTDSNGSITVDEVITASTKALDGCDITPTPSPMPSTTLTADVTATLTHTPDTTSTPAETGGPEGTETAEPTSEPTTLETQTPAATITNGMMPVTQSPRPTTPLATATQPPPTEPPAPTQTAIVVPTTPIILPTQTAAPLPTHTSGGGTRLDVGSASGAPGSTVSITVTLSGGNGVLTATSNDIIYDSSRVRAVQSGGPACTISPAIGPGSAINKMLLTSIAAPSATLQRLRAGVISFTTPSTIPDGLLFVCQFEIAAEAPPGSVVLQNAPSASNLIGDAVPIAGANGTIVVQ